MNFFRALSHLFSVRCSEQSLVIEDKSVLLFNAEILFNVKLLLPEEFMEDPNIWTPISGLSITLIPFLKSMVCMLEPKDTIKTILMESVAHMCNKIGTLNLVNFSITGKASITYKYSA